jgi:hypothetical protein
MMRFVLSSVFFGTVFSMGCGDTSLLEVSFAPNVAITEPLDESLYEEGEVIDFEGIVSDNSLLETLDVRWRSSIDGELPDPGPLDTYGETRFSTASLTPGIHVISLTAIDEDAEQGDAKIRVEIKEVPEAPAIEIRYPEPSGQALEDVAYAFLVRVSDRQDVPEDLYVEASSDVAGFICTMPVDGGGNASCSDSLNLGVHLLTFRVEDTDGNIAEAMVDFSVVTPGDYDADKDGFTPNGGDCDDSNASIYPGAPEICDGLDNDCITTTAIDVGTTCYDDDGDKYCEAPPCVNTTKTLIDCDDTQPSISPVAPEAPNGKDDNCNGIIDETTVVYDDDGDGYCESPPCVNTFNSESDCDDTDYLVYPTAREKCGNSVDENCNGLLNEKDALGCTPFYYDGDGDTYGITGATECWCEDGVFPYTGRNNNDCYDSNASVWPGNPSYYTTHRGDGSFDYDCSGSAQKHWQGTTGGCSWDTLSISCGVNGKGWQGSEPSCGNASQYVSDCDASYSALCYAACLLSYSSAADIINCLVSSCGASCDPDYDNRTQECR